MLQTRNLTYRLGNKTILDDISLDVAAGEFVALLGPNGSGKTTLIRALSGALRGFSGSASVELLLVDRLLPRGLAKKIAVVPQDAHFSFPFTALEVVLMGRHPYHNGFSFESIEDYHMARTAMERTDCWQFARQNIQTLSGGEKQRVLLARALAQKTKVLLLDEPASHLDLKHQVELFEFLSVLNGQEKITILCVVHDINMASRYCKKIIFLKEGRLVLQGNTQDILNSKNIETVFGIRTTPIKQPDSKTFFMI